MSSPRQVVMTVAMGPPIERLDRTFLSFAQNAQMELHAFIIGPRLPERQFPKITYHLVVPTPDFSDPLREVYFRRLQLVDEVGAEFVLVVDCYDVLCLQTLPPIPELLGNAAIGACTEHSGSRYLLGQGYTSNYLNCGVTFWNAPASREIRREIFERGRAQFRAVVDDQLALNEVIHTRYYDQLRILPCQYNYRCYFGMTKKGWPTVTHLEGVMIYHNGFCIEAAKRLLPIRPKADLPPLAPDARPLTRNEQLWRRLKQRLRPHIIE